MDFPAKYIALMERMCFVSWVEVLTQMSFSKICAKYMMLMNVPHEIKSREGLVASSMMARNYVRGR